MENQNQPTSEGTKPTHNMTDAEALRILASCLSQSLEANREWRKFVRPGSQEEADQLAELRELEAAETWLAKPEPTADETTKAARQVFDMIETSYKPRDQRDLAEWLVSTMSPDTVKGLAADYDEASA